MTRTLIFAHRGANQEAAENTRSAFEAALRYPIDGLETDVQLTRDGIPVLWHDRYLNKLGLPDWHIDDFDYESLRKMNFAAHYALKRQSADIKPEGILGLQEFISAYRTRCRLLIEIKNRAWEPPARHETKMRVALEMAGDAPDDAIVISSFNLDSLVFAQALRPGFPLVHNIDTGQTPGDAMRTIDENGFLHGLCLPIEMLDSGITAFLREHGKSIAVYTCNSDEDIDRALALDVDILISDVPQKAIIMRNKYYSGPSNT
jgi:glycerophosphoryl diester phosphodiesterase